RLGERLLGAEGFQHPSELARLAGDVVELRLGLLFGDPPLAVETQDPLALPLLLGDLLEQRAPLDVDRRCMMLALGVGQAPAGVADVPGAIGPDRLFEPPGRDRLAAPGVPAAVRDVLDRVAPVVAKLVGAMLAHAARVRGATLAAGDQAAEQVLTPRVLLRELAILHDLGARALPRRLIDQRRVPALDRLTPTVEDVTSGVDRVADHLV